MRRVPVRIHMALKVAKTGQFSNKFFSKYTTEPQLQLNICKSGFLRLNLK